MIERWLERVITNFYAHAISNVLSEGLNSKIQRFRMLACGFRNREHFHTAIFFACGSIALSRYLPNFQMTVGAALNPTERGSDRVPVTTRCPEGRRRCPNTSPHPTVTPLIAQHPCSGVQAGVPSL
jgi:transposase